VCDSFAQSTCDCSINAKACVSIILGGWERNPHFWTFHMIPSTLNVHDLPFPPRLCLEMDHSRLVQSDPKDLRGMARGSLLLVPTNLNLTRIAVGGDTHLADGALAGKHSPIEAIPSSSVSGTERAISKNLRDLDVYIPGN